MQSSKTKQSRGFFLVFTVIMLVPIICMIAFMVDIGRVVISARNLQVAAEAASLAGVERVRKCDANEISSTPLAFDCSAWPLVGGTATSGNGGWQAVKPAVLTALNDIRISGSSLGTMSMVAGATQCDIVDTIDGFGNLQFENGTNTNGDLTFQVERLYECLESGNLTLKSLEQSAGLNPHKNYCLANAVRVTLTYTGHQNLLATFFGAPANVSLTKTSVARMRPTDPTLVCVFPPCDLLNSPICSNPLCP